MGRSSIAFVIISLDIEGSVTVLLRANLKWRDWSFVGGHVEPGEERDWSITASRETEEEVPPLRATRDFWLEEIPGTLTWTAPSRSVGGEVTSYEVRCFLLRFKEDPRVSLRCVH